MPILPTLKPRVDTLDPRRLPMASKAGATERVRGRTWQRVRKSVLVRDGYRCAQCGAIDISHEVDHIIPLEAGGAAVDDTNLQTLCEVCHGAKTAQEANWRSGKL